jgi:hypothetical protein
MNYFEQELRRVAKACGGFNNPTFAGRACYGDLGGDNRVKLQFVTLGHSDHYEALEATILNRGEGKVDGLLLRFEDIWGAKQVSNPNFREGVIPYIWTYNGKSEWYVYKPTDADIKQLAAEVGAYISVFADRSLVPDRAQIGERESVVQRLRDAKSPPTTQKDKSGRKKHDPER